jgi:hypothetical protein
MSGQRGPTGGHGCHRVTPISPLPVIRTPKIGPDGEPPAGSHDVLPVTTDLWRSHRPRSAAPNALFGSLD